MNRFKSHFKRLMWFITLLPIFMAGCADNNGAVAISTLKSVVVTPAAASIPITGSQQFTATATYNNGSTRDVTATSTWSAANVVPGPVVATVSNVVGTKGIATGITAGTSHITASFGGKTSLPATLTVNTATSVLFMVTPALASIPVSGTQQFAALEIFSDGSHFDRTTTSVWSTSGASAANATLGAATGLATGLTVTPAGVPVVINATFTPVVGPAKIATTADLTINAATSVSFVVTPALASIPVSGTQQFAAIETFSNGTSFDRTTASVWSKSGASAANATLGAATGLATGLTVTPAGVPVVINATFTPLVGPVKIATPADLTVTAATSVSFVVRPVTASIPVGGNLQFAAIETFSDGTIFDRTTASAWSTSGASATNATLGAATGLATGLTVTPAGVPVVINATFTPLVGPVKVAIPADLNVTAAGPVPGPGPGAAGAVDLKSATPFGLIAYNSITNSAGLNSHIYGDVALTQPGPGGTIASVTGPGTNDFGVAPLLKSSIVTDSAGVTPGLITAANNGTPANIAALPQLLIDLGLVYNDLFNRAAPLTPITTPLSASGISGGTFTAPTNDLTGYILSPGIYTATGTYGLSNLSGPLVLDAGGNPNAVFIIRSTNVGPSGFTSTTGSVVLQNGAQAKNVFWVMDNLTVGSGTFFQGTVVAGHAITLLAHANVEGRMLAGALGLVSGALTLTDTNVITVPK